MAEFNPADSHVDEVKAYVEAHPGELAAVLEAERAGKNRSTLVSYLEELGAGAPEAPENVEPESVTVAPADQSAANILGVDYTVSPDRGFRRS